MANKTYDKQAFYDQHQTRCEFRDRDDLMGYLAETFGITQTVPGTFRAQSSELVDVPPLSNPGARRVLFDDPILDRVTSPDGLIQIGGVSHDVRKHFLHDRGTTGIAFALKCITDPSSGLERCDSDDGSTIIYKSGDDTITFKTFSTSTLGYWKIGTRITTHGPGFDAARIDSRHYFTALNQTCTAIPRQHEHLNDDSVSQYEYGWLGEKPIRLVSLCRAQWKGKRISGLVSRGSDCFSVGADPLPTGYPADWPPITSTTPQGSIIINPQTITLISLPSQPTPTKAIKISNTHDSAKVVTVGEVEILGDDDTPGISATANALQPQGEFSNTSGQFTIPPDGSVQVTVSFTGQKGLGSLQARIPISRDGIRTNVSVTGSIVQVTAAF